MTSVQSRRESCPMYGVYDLAEIDKQTGMRFPQHVGLYHVVRPHTSFYYLETIVQDADPYPMLEKVQMDEGDVLLVTPPKTGTQWLYEILRMLKAGKADYIKNAKTSEWIDIKTYDKVKGVYPSGSRVINTHLMLSDVPSGFRRPDTKVILSMRNLKDVIVSYHCHWMLFRQTAKEGEWEEWQKTFKYFLYSRMNTWDAHRFDPNVLVVWYEDLKRDPEKEIKRMADHIQVCYTNDLICQISDAVKDISKMRLGKAPTEDYIREKYGEDKSLYRKGEVGDWKNWFTVSQNEEFHKVVDSWNMQRQIPFVYDL